ncbi:MAG: Lrp/AsnC family transcriptional regulator [Calditrichaeota bacterium]|nr:MAG: Lrp/AsnC family transcriptional regulator [Calditrichota bacterium]
MNDLDAKILQRLAEDARTPHAQIAEDVRLSRPAVAERIKKLEHAGVIQGYTAVVNPEAVGKSVTAFISAKLPGVVDREVRAALQALLQNEDILEVHAVAGDDCFLLKVRTADMHSLNEIVNSLKEPPLSFATRTTIVLETYFEKIGGAVLYRQDSK